MGTQVSARAWTRWIRLFAAAVALVAAISPALGFVSAGPAGAVPGSGTANNPWPTSPSCQISVALVLDRSNSIAKNNSNNPTLMKNAAKSFVDSLAPTSSSVGVYSFGTVASGFTGSNPIGGASVSASDYPSIGYTAVGTPAGATSVKNVIDSIPFSTSSNLGATNWEAGLGYASNGITGAKASNGDTPADADVVVLLTDGNPTVNNADFSSGGSTNDADVNAGITAADALKSNNHTRVVAVGIGSDIDSANLERVTGGYPASVEGDDYYLSDFSALGQTLYKIATELCGGSLTINKLQPSGNPVSWVPRPGFTFNTSFPDGHATQVDPAPGNQQTDANGQVKYTWVSDGSAVRVVVQDPLGPDEVQYSAECTIDGKTTAVYGTADITVPVNADAECTFKNYTPNPSIAITKTPSVPAVTGANRDVTFTVGLSNPSALDTVNLSTLTDDVYGDLFDPANPLVSSNTCPALLFSALAPGASTSCHFTAQVLGDAGGPSDPHVDTVTVLGYGPQEQDVTASASATVDIIDPAIALTKTVDKPTVLSGSTATYTLAATNAGDTPLAGVTLSDPGCTGLSGPVKTGGDQDALLEAGEVWTWTCTATITTATTNVATVDAVDDVLQTPVSAQAQVDVRVIAPAIHLEKSVDQPVVLAGTDVTYTLVATNAGDTPLANVAVSDPDCGAISGPTKTGGDQDDLLEAGEAWTYTCTATITADTTNTATATAVDNVLQSPVSDTDSATVDVIAPAIHLEKSVDQPVVLAGTNVTYTLVATNAGDTPLASVVVTDPNCGSITGPAKSGGDADGLLEAGETWTFTCSATITADTTNTATATAVDNVLQSPVSDTDSATVNVIAPAIHLEKSVDQPVVLSGTEVTYTLVATNTGDTPLANVAVSDPDCGAISGPAKTGGDQDSLLEAGEAWTYTCTATITTDTTNTATATAVDDVLESPVSDTATADVAVIAPGIQIVKTVDQPVVLAGTEVTYTLAVTNTGDTPLASVTVDDPGCSGLDGPVITGGNQDALLDAGEVWTYTCTATITADTTNTATATGYDRELQTKVTDSDSVDVEVIAPAINLTKAVDQPVVLSGTTVTYTLVATSTGDTPLTSVAINDPGCTGLSGPTKTGGNQDDVLEAGETWTWTCTAVVTADTTNVATATAVDVLIETPVSDTAQVSVDVIDPQVAIDKTADATEVIDSGTVTYTYTVTNPGDTDLTDVAVSDDTCSPVTYVSGDTGDDGILGVDESWTYTCEGELDTTTTNTATVTAIDTELQTTVTDTAEYTVTVSHPAIDVTKTADPTSVVNAGDTVTYTYVVTNTGDVPLTNVTLTDDKLGDITLDVTDLAVGESTTATATYETQFTDANSTIVNVATATGDYEETTVTDTATASVEVGDVLATSSTSTSTSTTIGTGATSTPTQVASTPLARTGADLWRYAISGFALLAAGVVLALASRRRRQV